jgi:hypothetical protein
MGRILPGDITRPFEARKARQINYRDSFAARVGERALGSFLTPQGVATGVKLVAPFIKMGGGEEAITEEGLGLSPAEKVAAQRTQAIPSGAQGPTQQPVLSSAPQATEPLGKYPLVPAWVREPQRLTVDQSELLRRSGGAPGLAAAPRAATETLARMDDVDFIDSLTGLTTSQEELDRIKKIPDRAERIAKLRQFSGARLAGPPPEGAHVPEDPQYAGLSSLPAVPLAQAAIDRINEKYKDNPKIRSELLRAVMKGTLRGLPEVPADSRAAAVPLDPQAAIDRINEVYKDNPKIRSALLKAVMKGTLKSSPALMGKIYDEREGQAVLKPEVQAQLEWMAKDLGGSPLELLKALIPESGMDTTAVNPASGASGLIQFTTTALNEMKRKKLIPKETSLDSIRRMDAKEQLNLAHSYFKMHAGSADYSRPGEFSVAIFAPVGLGQPRSTVLYGGKTKAYTQNREVDAKDPKKRKGYITVDDYLKFKDRLVTSFEKKAKLPVFTTETEELQKFEPIPGVDAPTPEVVGSGIRDQVAQVSPLPSVGGGLPGVAFGTGVPPQSESVAPTGSTEETPAVVGEPSQPTPQPAPVASAVAGPAIDEEHAFWREQDRLGALPDTTKTPPAEATAESMLRSLAKVGSFRDQQRYIEGALRRGDLDSDQVQALTMAAGLIRDQMQPRTLAEALYAADRGSTVGDLWYNKTMQGVKGRGADSGLTAYQHYMMGRHRQQDEEGRAERRLSAEQDRLKVFAKEVEGTRAGVRRIRDAYNKMNAQKLIESEILTDARKMLSTIGKHEREMNRILREARNPKANIEQLEADYAKVGSELTSSTSRLQSILSKSKNADKISDLTGDLDVGESGDTEGARAAMGN